MRRSVKRISDKKLTLILTSIIAAVAVVAVAAAVLVRLADGGWGSVSSNPSVQSSNIASDGNIVSSSIAQSESDEIVYESDDGTNFNVPDTLRAVYLKPGRDFLIKTTDSEQAIKSQLDAAMKSTAKLGFNSVVIFTETAQGVLFDDGILKPARSDFDIVQYAISAAKSQNLYSYVVYPVLLEKNGENNTIVSDFSDEKIKILSNRAAAFAKKYKPSAIVFDNYCVKKTDDMEAFYQSSKSSKTYEDFLREQLTLVVRKARNEIRKNNNVSQVGFLSASVWANVATNSKGSQTTADFESYVNGFADTRDWVLNEKFNFIMVENLMPTDSVKNNFSVIANWWSTICSQSDTAFYNIHASSKLTTTLGEFSSPDQLIKQVSVVKPLKAYGGSVFDSLPALLEDKDGSTTLLLKYFENQLENSLIFSKLKMSSPAKNSITTYDSTILFSGATDPNFQTTFNGKKIEVTEKGYFTIDADLQIGTNTFKISHKGKTVTYTVVRKVKLIETVGPTGTLEVDGGTAITLSVKGYTGSKITATVGKSTVTLAEQKPDQATDGETISSQYVDFVGTFTAPAATTSVQNLGAIKFTATWQSFSESASGATVKIFAKPVISGNNSAIQITEEHAETFPTDRLNDQSQPYCYPLPAGTIDFVVGNELSYTQDGVTYKYYKLKSGHRVYSKDVKILGKVEKGTNEISSVDIAFDGRFVNLKVKNSWEVPFKYIEEPISYKSDGVTLNGDYKITKITYRIFYTDKIDLSKVTLDKNNPMISAVNCELKNVKVDSVDIPVCDIVLTLRTTGGFFGATPDYDGTSLNIRLNTAAPIQKADNAYGYTLKGAVIVVDAGHDKLSPGSSGVLMDPTTGKYKYPEYLMNEQMRDKVVAILKNLGATVITIDNNKLRYADERLKYFKSVDPHIMICIHHNASNTSYARGPVGLYFNSYSQLLNKYIMTNVANNYINNDSNRAQSHTFNRLKMTREPYYPSMLIECGFITNAEEQEQLVNPANQQKIADQMVRGMINYFIATGSLNYELLKPAPEDESNTPSDTQSSIATPEIPSQAVFYDNKKIFVA